MYSPVRNLWRKDLEHRFNSERRHLLHQLNEHRTRLSRPYDQNIEDEFTGMSEAAGREFLINSYRAAEKTAKALAKLSRRLGYGDGVANHFEDIAREQHDERVLAEIMRPA